MHYLLLILVLLFGGCSDGSSSSNPTPDGIPSPDATAPDTTAPDAAAPDAAAPDQANPGPAVGELGGACTAEGSCNEGLECVDNLCAEPSVQPADWFTYEAGPFTVPAGEEKYYCFSYVLEEDLWVDQVVIESQPVVHHLVYSKTMSPDPEGFYECNVLFQGNWVPIFIAGTGDAELTMPEGAGYILKKGTQLTAQFHLLNVTLEDVTHTIPLRFRKMAAEPENPVEVVVFGNMTIALPPGQTSEVVGDCDSDSDMILFSAFPHMHLLGRSMVVETGPDVDNMTEIFRRDPYDFDQQTLSDLDVEIKKGDRVRVTCGYDNYLDELVTFGESTTNEMCFFLGYATKATHQLAGCIGGSGGSIAPEGCGEDPPNNIGLGATCTEGGGECAGDLMCTEDIEQTQGLNICLGMGCGASSDCGEGGVCCKIDVGFQLELCLPPSCVFSICEILE
jgi:hypothetical protein